MEEPVIKTHTMKERNGDCTNRFLHNRVLRVHQNVKRRRRRRLQALEYQETSVGGSKVESKVTQEGRSHCWPYIAGGGRRSGRRAGPPRREQRYRSVPPARLEIRPERPVALWEEYTLYLNATGLESASIFHLVCSTLPLSLPPTLPEGSRPLPCSCGKAEISIKAHPIMPIVVFSGRGGEKNEPFYLIYLLFKSGDNFFSSFPPFLPPFTSL